MFATQLCKLTGARRGRHVVSSTADKGRLVEQLGATGYIDRNEYLGMVRKGGESPEAEETARFKESRRFVRRGNGGDPGRGA